VDLRATTNGAGLVTIPRRLIESGSGPVAPPPIPSGAAPAHPPTTVDPVEELSDLPSPLPTPPLGSVSRVEADAGVPRLLTGKSDLVPMPTQPPLTRTDGVVESGRLQTPSGRPPAPGMSNAVTGVMLREEAEETSGPQRVTREMLPGLSADEPSDPPEPAETTPVQTDSDPEDPS